MSVVGTGTYLVIFCYAVKYGEIVMCQVDFPSLMILTLRTKRA